MASVAFTDGFVMINAVNMSGFARKVSLKQDGAELDDTAFGDTTHSRIGGGLKDYTLDVEWNQDFAAASTDALLWALFNTVTTFEIRPTSAARSATNPAYTGSVHVGDYTPFDGAVGDLLTLSTSWKAAAPAVRQTS